MKVSIQKIQRQDLSFSFTEKDGWLREIANRLSKSENSPKISAQVDLSMAGQSLQVRGSGQATLHNECARCLRKVENTLSPTFDLAFLPASAKNTTRQEDEEYELDVEEIEEYTYSGDDLDLSEILNEQFVLVQPYRILCQEDCSGICANCGANKNETKCDCTGNEGHPGFAALADLKIDKSS